MNSIQEKFRDTAKFLFAADAVLWDDMTFKTATDFAETVWASLEKEPWVGGKHFGDCTMEPQTCNRCLTTAYEKEARERYESDD